MNIQTTLFHMMNFNEDRGSQKMAVELQIHKQYLPLFDQFDMYLSHICINEFN